MTSTHLARLAKPTVIRRNVPLRMAGASYAAITGLWLVATLGHVGHGAWVGEALFALLALSGLVFALFRDDVLVDTTAGTVTQLRGLPGLAVTTTRRLADFDGIAIEEDAIDEFEDGGIRPVRRAWFSVVLLDSRTRRPISLWSGDSDESESARSKLREQASSRAQSFSDLVGLPIQTPRP